MEYELKKIDASLDDTRNNPSKLLVLLKGEYIGLGIALLAILINSGLNIFAPLLLGQAVDIITKHNDFDALKNVSIFLFITYSGIALTSYLQTILTGSMGQRILFKLRNQIFEKLQSFPIAFFNANKSGDLISRINNDTEKLNNFFSEGLVRLVGEIFTIAGIGIFIVILNWKLGLITLAAAVVLFIVTTVLTPWIRRRNRLSLEATGDFAADIQENLNNYKVLVVFNRKSYFRDKMQESISRTYEAATRAGIANNISGPLYFLANRVSLLLVLVFGFYLVSTGEITIGLLVTFIAYANNFYSPLQEMAQVYSIVQTAIAAWDRIQEILGLEINIKKITDPEIINSDNILEFKNVDFGYSKDNIILKNINFEFHKGYTYALVGPTGGGKSTTAALMARLYDPVEGKVFLKGKDIRSYSDEEKSQIIGFILQDPYIFSGTVYENIIYGNRKYEKVPQEEVVKVLEQKELIQLIEKFPGGLESQISSTDENISLGQKQLVAFLRVLLREPELLILDEATANIDTITEEALQKIIDHLPKETTKVIIAHRLNTIQKADEIIFISGGVAQSSRSFDEVVKLIGNTKRES